MRRFWGTVWAEGAQLGMHYLRATKLLISLAMATACGGSDGNDGEAPAPANFTQQVARGSEVYAARCSKCHGEAGEGIGDAPAVVGPTALPLDPPSGATLRKSRFVTVADVATFVVQNMPGDDPGSLGQADYFAVLAFDLKANGIDLGTQKLDAALAASLTIPRE